MPGRRLNHYEITMVHIVRSQLGWDEETYRDILQSRYKHSSSLEMHIEDYGDFMKFATALGFHEDPRKKQKKEVKRLCAEHQCDNKRLCGIIKHVTKIDAPPRSPLKWLDTKQLSALIQALRRWGWDSQQKTA
jgi:hypothetical protein